MSSSENQKVQILLQTEGSYPYIKTGGVSAWAQSFIRGADPQLEFYVYSIIDSPHRTEQMEIPKNVRSVIKVPLWGSEFPEFYYNPDTPFSKLVSSREATTPRIIHEYFLPLFKELLNFIEDPFQDPSRLGEILYGCWKYFQVYSYKKTLQEQVLWLEFKERQLNSFQKDSMNPYLGQFSLLDETFGMRWLYHFLMPLDVPIPRVDVSHSLISGFPNFPSIIAKFEYGTPFLITDHGVWIREQMINLEDNSQNGYHSNKFLLHLSTLAARLGYHYADLITPVTTANKKWEVQMGADPSKIYPILNGVDVDHFSPRSSWKQVNRRPTVVSLASVMPLKDIKTMIRTCDHVRQKIPDVQFLLYGSNEVNEEYYLSCLDEVRKLKLENHFYFKGFHENPEEIYQEGDVMLLTSISEGSPFVIIEAMSCACPIVATDVGGVRELLPPEMNTTCMAGDDVDLAWQVVRLLKDESLREEYGKISRKRAVEELKFEKVIEEYKKRYLELNNRKNRALKHSVKSDAVSRVIEFIEN